MFTLTSVFKYYWYELFVVLGVILLSKSLYYETYGTNLLLIPFLMILFIFNVKKTILIDKKIVLYSSLILFIIIINPYVQYSSVMVLVNCILISILVVATVDFQKFSKIYIDIIILISAFSLLFWVVIMFNIHSVLPDFVGIDTRHLRNFIFFGVSESLVKYASYRNSGLWWEPGAFATLVNLAFIFSIINRTINKRKYFFFALVVITMKSTTGFIVFGLLSIIFWKNFLLISKNKVIYMTILSLLFLVALLFIGPLILDKFDSESNSYISFLSRYYDGVISLNMFLDNFLIGYGYGSQIMNAIPYGTDLIGDDLYYSLARPSGADGITMFIAQVGLFAFLFLFPLLIPSYFKHLKVLDKIIISISLFIVFNTENFTFLLIFTTLTFYGIVGYTKLEGTNENTSCPQ